jgi:hypothetical protein
MRINFDHFERIRDPSVHPDARFILIPSVVEEGARIGARTCRWVSAGGQVNEYVRKANVLRAQVRRLKDSFGGVGRALDVPDEFQVAGARIYEQIVLGSLRGATIAAEQRGFTGRAGRLRGDC